MNPKKAKQMLEGLKDPEFTQGYQIKKKNILLKI